MAVSRNKKTKHKIDAPMIKKLNELYDWYSRKKLLIEIWETLSLWIATLIIIALFVFVYLKITEGIKNLWPHISLDAKFQGLIAVLIFVLGLIIGRKSRKKGR